MDAWKCLIKVKSKKIELDVCKKIIQSTFECEVEKCSDKKKR